MSTVNSLPPPPGRVPLQDPRTGLLSPAWENWFRTLYGRVGGPTAPSNVDLSTDLFEDAGSSEAFAAIIRMDNDLQQNPPVSTTIVPDVLADANIETLRGLVYELRKEIDALKQAIQS
jgi:hypothetical protein